MRTGGSYIAGQDQIPGPEPAVEETPQPEPEPAPADTSITNQKPAKAGFSTSAAPGKTQE